MAPGTLAGNLLGTSVLATPTSGTSSFPRPHIDAVTPAAVPNPGRVSSSAVPTPAPQSTSMNSPAPPTGPIGVATAEDAIRPMTLAPAPIDSSGPREASLATLDDESGGSGGGGPPPDMPPILNFSGGGSEQDVDANGQPIPGKYIVRNPVPIGTVAVLSVDSPASGYDFQTYAWSGGTNYSGYFSADPVTPPSGGQELDQNVATTTSNYVFIVDANARDYTISVSVDYGNGAHGTSTLTFSSARPSGSLSVSQVGTQSTSGSYRPGEVTVWLNPGINIQATASTGQYTAGSFMFMQVINTNRKEVTDSNNQPYYIDNDIMIPGGENFNGPLIDDSPIGYNFTYDGTSDLHGWYLPPNNSMPVPPASPPVVEDLPRGSVPNTFYRVFVDESFSTYLMYKPAGPVGGVWIALSAVDWSWSKELARPLGGSWTATPPSSQPTPTTRMPSGADAFPTWVNTATNFNTQNLNPYRPGP